MDAIMQALSTPGDMTRIQWLLVAIMAFVVVGSVFFVWKLYAIIVSSRKETYVPNIGLKRMKKAAEDSASGASGKGADEEK